MEFFTPYQIFLLAVLLVWPLVITGILFLMSRLETYVARQEAETPEEAGLVPITGTPPDREVKIVVGDQVVVEPE